MVAIGYRANRLNTTCVGPSNHTPSQCRPSVQHCSLPCPFPRQSRPKVDTGSKYAVSTNQKRVFHRISHLDGRKKYNSTTMECSARAVIFYLEWCLTFAIYPGGKECLVLGRNGRDAQCWIIVSMQESDGTSNQLHVGW